MRDIFFHNILSSFPQTKLPRVNLNFKNMKILHKDLNRYDAEVQASPPDLDLIVINVRFYLKNYRINRETKVLLIKLYLKD